MSIEYESKYINNCRFFMFKSKFMDLGAARFLSLSAEEEEKSHILRLSSVDNSSRLAR